MNKWLVVIAGPTASGKTEAAISLAKYFHAEILSADARQFYREMNIGTAKPSTKQLAEVKHHFINSISVHDLFTVADFENEAVVLVNDLFKKNDIVFLVGGAGLFIRAVCEGLDELPDTDAEIRKSLEQILHEEGLIALQNKLKTLDPVSFSRIELQNPRRVMRAVEVSLQTGKPYSSFLNKKSEARNFSVIKIGLDVEREELYKRINNRADEMIQDGLLEEVKNLFPNKNLLPLQTVGYSELFEFLEGKTTLEKAIEKVKQNTRNYAKRQMTWFRKEKKMQWFQPNAIEEMIAYIKNVVSA
jgi:tRNA dimethylallyltransferase